MDDENLALGSGKKRMKWTPELRQCFDEAVNKLGGADRATPKAIFKAMSMPGLTIPHVKSHLQKYRHLNFVQESSERGKLETKTTPEILQNFSAASKYQITEALKMHMEARQTSHDSLQAGKLLKIRIELQGRYLEKLTEEDHLAFSSNCRTILPFQTTLSPFSDLSESNSWNYGSDSDAVPERFLSNSDLQEQCLPRNLNWQTKSHHSTSHTGLSAESTVPISSNTNTSVSHPFRKLKVAARALPVQP